MECCSPWIGECQRNIIVTCTAVLCITGSVLRGGGSEGGGDINGGTEAHSPVAVAGHWSARGRDVKNFLGDPRRVLEERLLSTFRYSSILVMSDRSFKSPVDERGFYKIV